MTTDELRAKLAAATAGPWRVEHRGVGRGVSHFIMARRHVPVARTVSRQSSDPAMKEQVEANAAAIVACVNYCRDELPALVERVKELEGALGAFLVWADRAQDGESGTHYLNGEKEPWGNGDDGWEDLDALRERARATGSSEGAGR